MARTGKRGFGSMDPKKQREIASKGGKAAHKSGRAHEWDREEAQVAGRKGGLRARGGRGAIPKADVAGIFIIVGLLASGYMLGLMTHDYVFRTGLWSVRVGDVFEYNAWDHSWVQPHYPIHPRHHQRVGY